MRLTLEELKSIWLHAYSRSSFVEAHQWLVDMETVEPNSSHFRALIYGAVVAYVRPFTKSRVLPGESLVPLTNVNPPTHLARAHQRLSRWAGTGCIELWRVCVLEFVLERSIFYFSLVKIAHFVKTRVFLS